MNAERMNWVLIFVNPKIGFQLTMLKIMTWSPTVCKAFFSLVTYNLISNHFIPWLQYYVYYTSNNYTTRSPNVNKWHWWLKLDFSVHKEGKSVLNVFVCHSFFILSVYPKDNIKSMPNMNVWYTHTLQVRRRVLEYLEGSKTPLKKICNVLSQELQTTQTQENLIGTEMPKE